MDEQEKSPAEPQPPAEGEPVEIHPPEKPIHNWKDFTIQIATITLGILIALSLEGLLEWNHHRKLVREAKENLAHEIADNRKEVESALAGLPEQRKRFQNALKFATDLIRDRKTDIHEVQIGFGLPVLSDASWKTAQSTGALGHMKYADVKRYAEVYTMQETYLQMQSRKLDRLSLATSALYGGDPMKASAQDLESLRQQMMLSLADTNSEESLGKSLQTLYSRILSAK